MQYCYVLVNKDYGNILDCSTVKSDKTGVKNQQTISLHTMLNVGQQWVIMIYLELFDPFFDQH